MLRAEGKHLSGRRITVLVVTGLVLAFIFVQSMLPQMVSANESGWVTEKILKPVFRLFGMKPPTHHFVRKLAHVTEFAALSALLVLCFLGEAFKSVCVAFAAAFSDESIQLLSGRGASITDVWIDLIGIAIGTLFGMLVWILIRRLYRNRMRQAGPAQKTTATETIPAHEMYSSDISCSDGVIGTERKI